MKTHTPARLRLSAIFSENLSLYLVLIGAFLLMFVLNGERFIRPQTCYRWPISYRLLVF
jgi:simple sugar transport system permease protein